MTTLVQPMFVTVSTHSRPKAAGARIDEINLKLAVSTHSRPKAAEPPLH